MYAVILPLIFFVSDVQINAISNYPDSVASIVSSHIGGEAVYDCGDLVEHGGFLESQEYARYRELFPGSVPVPGNHDHYDGLSEWSWQTGADTTCTGGIRLVGFDSNLWNDPEQVDMLRTRLTDGDTFTVLYMHHPLYSDNLRNGRLADIIRPVLLPVVEETGVDLVVSGHGHAFEHHVVEGRHYVVVGGGGAPLDAVGSSATNVFSVSAHHWLEMTPVTDGVVCRVKDLTGDILYRFTVTRGDPTPAPESTWGGIKALYRPSDQ